MRLPMLISVALAAFLAACAAPGGDPGRSKAALPASDTPARAPAGAQDTPSPALEPRMQTVAAPGPGQQEAAEPATPSRYAGWSGMVIAADNRATGGELTEAFDNARRDVAKRLLQWGFPAQSLRQYSIMPERYPEEPVLRITPSRFARDLARLKMATGQGCLFYMTSHGTQAGITVNNGLLSPDEFWNAVDRLCARQPVIAIVSACHSGVFAEPRFQAPARFIFTAARADRTSFGCGKDDVYPYFDACFLEAADGAPAGQTQDWLALAEATRACVARREQAKRLTPSEPQLFVGDAIRPFVKGPPASAGL